MAIVVGGIYSVVSSSSSGHESAKNKNKTKNPKNREELNDGEGHHEPLLIEETAETKSAVESKEDDDSVSARNTKTKEGRGGREIGGGFVDSKVARRRRS